jgi:hypothetical protein
MIQSRDQQGHRRHVERFFDALGLLDELLNTALGLLIDEAGG